MAKLKSRGSLSAEFAVTCITVLDAIDDDWLFGIPFQRRVGSGTRYGDDHFCMIRLSEGRPGDATIYVNGITIMIDEFSKVDPSGGALTKVIGAARISRTPLPHWETQTLSEPNSY